jgi:hypothetical protein
LAIAANTAEVQKIPKPILRARAEFASQGLDPNNITGEDIKDWSNNKCNGLFNALRSNLTNDPDKRDRDRRVWLGRFIVDPKSGGCKCLSTTTIYNTKSVDETEQWLHESEIAGPNYLNNKEMAKMLCTSGELE